MGEEEGVVVEAMVAMVMGKVVMVMVMMGRKVVMQEWRTHRAGAPRGKEEGQG